MRPDSELTEAEKAMKKALMAMSHFKARMKDQRNLIPFKAESGTWVYYCDQCAKPKAISSNNKTEWGF